MEIVIGLVILYVIQAVLVYGMTYGYFEARWPNTGNVSVAVNTTIIAGVMPIIGPLIIFILSENVKHGLRYK
jgi:TRAP-type C4-dicarboxylate transport system permease small subunit